MVSSCSSLDSAASLLSIVASLLTIAAFGLRFLHERGLHPRAHDLLRNYLGGGEAPAVAAGELQEAVEKAKMTPADMSEVLLNQNRWNKERAVGEPLEVLRTRAERNEKYGGGPSEECELNGVAVEEEMVIFAS